MATLHVAAKSALMLQKNPDLGQAVVESKLKSTTLYIPPGSATVFDLSTSVAFVFIPGAKMQPVKMWHRQMMLWMLHHLCKFANG